MKKLLFVISQLYKGGAETALVNFLNNLDHSKYDIDLLILNQYPVADAVSLIGEVNDTVNICNAYERYQKLTLWSRIKAKLEYTTEQKTAFYLPALEFVKNKVYDWAFFVGEWYSPAFVAYHTNAKNKAAWIHSDLSKTTNFDKELYFFFYECFDYFIFASENSLKESIKQYPFLKDKSITIYNVNDVKSIRKKAKEPINDYQFDSSKPTLLTCANIRPEKNHIRQIKVLSELKKRGIRFNWINIGSTADTKLVNQVNDLVKQEGLEDDFIMLGPKKNPYKYMKNVDAVTVLSDYESWSMVITEAKILGIPVIATRTAGALEQIEHNKTGILTDFDIRSIADEIERFFKDSKLKEVIKHNLEHFDNTDEILNSFDKLVNSKKDQLKKEKILYIIDDINYQGGAHSATIYQIKKLLMDGKDISIFSTTIPNCKRRIELAGAKFLSWLDLPQYRYLNRRIIGCLIDKNISKKNKQIRMRYSLSRIRNNEKFIQDNIYPLVTNLFSNYDIINVMSEASVLRKYVAESKCNCKIQWIHTDYVAWSTFNEWTSSITKDDEYTYGKFDKLVLLSETLQNKFIEKYPNFKNKTYVVKNYIPINDIKNKSNIEMKPYPGVKFITVGRLSVEKSFERLIGILGKLNEEGYQFTWEIIGDGPLKSHLNDLIIQNSLEKAVFLLGHKANPYRYISDAQVFALLSNYEGMPNTIYESLILGVPVLATNVGGICEQIQEGVTGWVVENNEKSIYEGIKYIMENQELIDEMKGNLKQYVYDNEEVNLEIHQLLYGGKHETIL